MREWSGFMTMIKTKNKPRRTNIMKKAVIYETSLSPDQDTPVVENLQVTRGTDGSVTIRAIREVVGEYPISIPKILTAEEVELLATALMGTHPGYIELASRASA